MESGNTTKIPKSGDNLLPETTKHVGNVTFVVRLHDKAPRWQVKRTVQSRRFSGKNNEKTIQFHSASNHLNRKPNCCRSLVQWNQTDDTSLQSASDKRGPSQAAFKLTVPIQRRGQQGLHRPFLDAQRITLNHRERNWWTKCLELQGELKTNKTIVS